MVCSFGKNLRLGDVHPMRSLDTSARDREGCPDGGRESDGHEGERQCVALLLGLSVGEEGRCQDTRCDLSADGSADCAHDGVHPRCHARLMRRNGFDDEVRH